MHLSDLHIDRHPIGSPYDLDADLRALVELDLQALGTQLGAIDGILLTGDVAFSGHNIEYEKAAIWLDQLTARVGCPPSNVWVIPGNHDVDRSVLQASPDILAAHRHLRTCDLGRIGRELTRALLSPASPHILDPLANYNSFAAGYECGIDRQRPFWLSELSLTPDRSVVLLGLTSALISDETDDEGANKLVLGTFQSCIPRRDGDVVVVMCHHPPSWLRDCDEVEQYFDSRATIQLFGHKHVQRLGKYNNTVRLISGALHPDRDGSWTPRYNILQLEVAGESLHLQIHARRWDPTTTRFAPDFRADGAPFEELTLDLGPATHRQPLAAVELQPDRTVDKIEVVEPTSAPSERRELRNRLSKLSYMTQIAIGARLGLLAPTERRLRSDELLRALLTRARDLDRFDDLRRAVDTRLEDTPDLSGGS